MENYFEMLKKCELFFDIEEQNFDALLSCLTAEMKNYKKSDFIFRIDDKPAAVGIVLSGSVNVIQEDFWGSRSVIAHIPPGFLFAEAFCCALADRFHVNVIAGEKSDVMLIDYKRIITTCSSSCIFHLTLIKNMIRILAQKNIMLTKKIEHVTQKSTRAKLLSYFSEQAAKSSSRSFVIPFDRQGLADYLAVERSAMSNELSKLRGEGVLLYEKNKFILL